MQVRDQQYPAHHKIGNMQLQCHSPRPLPIQDFSLLSMTTFTGPSMVQYEVGSTCILLTPSQLFDDGIPQSRLCFAGPLPAMRAKTGVSQRNKNFRFGPSYSTMNPIGRRALPLRAIIPRFAARGPRRERELRYLQPRFYT